MMEENKFVHSVKVPNQYRKAAKLLKNTFEGGKSVKEGIFQETHVRTNRLYALIVKISKNKSTLDVLIERSSILKNEPRLDKYLCLVLMTELLFGPQKLNGQSKPVLCVLGYESKFREILNDLNKDLIHNTTEQFKDVVKPRYVRVNTNILSRADAIELFVKDGWNEIVQEFTDYDKFLEIVRNLGDYDFLSDMHVKNLFVFPASSKRYWAEHELVYEKKVILQDKASCLPAVLLDPPKGSVILDMCAAPGMKTTHLAAMIRNKGKIYAIERSPSRFKTLTEFVVGTKSTCVKPIEIDALTLEEMYVPNVEFILVDPSCSGSGMTNRLFNTIDKDPDRLANLTGLQSRMLSHAMRAFTTAKKIVYSTCSIHHEENEKVVQECLEMCPDWELIKPITFAEQWKHFGSPKYKHIGKKCLYAKSEIDLTDGFFVAIFERKVDSSKEIEPYDRNKAFLERIAWNFKPKLSSETTVQLYNDTSAQKDYQRETEDVMEVPVTNIASIKREKIKTEKIVADGKNTYERETGDEIVVPATDIVSIKREKIKTEKIVTNGQKIYERETGDEIVVPATSIKREKIKTEKIIADGQKIYERETGDEIEVPATDIALIKREKIKTEKIVEDDQNSMERKKKKKHRNDVDEKTVATEFDATDDFNIKEKRKKKKRKNSDQGEAEFVKCKSEILEILANEDPTTCKAMKKKKKICDYVDGDDDSNLKKKIKKSKKREMESIDVTEEVTNDVKTIKKKKSKKIKE